MGSGHCPWWMRVTEHDFFSSKLLLSCVRSCPEMPHGGVGGTGARWDPHFSWDLCLHRGLAELFSSPRGPSSGVCVALHPGSVPAGRFCPLEQPPEGDRAGTQTTAFPQLPSRIFSRGLCSRDGLKRRWERSPRLAASLRNHLGAASQSRLVLGGFPAAPCPPGTAPWGWGSRLARLRHWSAALGASPGRVMGSPGQAAARLWEVPNCFLDAGVVQVARGAQCKQRCGLTGAGDPGAGDSCGAAGRISSASES